MFFQKGIRIFLVGAIILTALAIWAVARGSYVLAIIEAWLATSLFVKYAAWFDEYGNVQHSSIRIQFWATGLILILVLTSLGFDRFFDKDWILRAYVFPALIITWISAMIIAPLFLAGRELFRAKLLAQYEQT